MTQDEIRRRSLSEFLKTRRARLSPTDVGFSNGRRRRTPGLRREEVAQLAGVGVTWYTWLEQGRDITVSDEVLDSIARTLQLDAYEIYHLYSLAKRQTPLLNHVADVEHVPPHLHRLLQHQGIYPAFIIGRYWDILAWNTSANLLLGELDRLLPDERNQMWHVFVNPMVRQCLVDWEEHAQRMVAEFRESYGRYIEDPAFTAFIERLKANSPEFAEWWSKHDVVGKLNVHKVFNYPDVGRLEFEQSTLMLSDMPHLRMIVKIPCAGTDTAEKLRMLLDDCVEP